MTLVELRDACLKQLEIGSDKVGLVLPGRWGKRNTRRLWPSGPVGEIYGELEDGSGIYVVFDAREVLAEVERLIKEVQA